MLYVDWRGPSSVQRRSVIGNRQSTSSESFFLSFFPFLWYYVYDMYDMVWYGTMVCMMAVMGAGASVEGMFERYDLYMSMSYVFDDVVISQGWDLGSG